jgi:V/A-type H+-transporting ATPase subunit E
VDKARGTERYIKFLTSLIENAVNYVQSRDVIIYTSPKDRGVVETVARSLGLTGMVAEKDIRGGVIVAARDGSVAVDYSLETLLANKLDDLKHLLYSETV